MIKFTWTDKDSHSFVGCGIAMLFGLLFWYFTPIWPFFAGAIGFGIGTLAGYVKEKNDRRKTKTFNKEDFIATLWGSLVGAIIITVVLLNL